MKQFIALLFLILPGAVTLAQNETEVQFQTEDPLLDVQEVTSTTLTINAPVFLPSPYGGELWDIHTGFNANIEAGVMCGFGKNNPFRGAAFFTSIDGLYAFPVNDKLTLSAGLGYTRYTGWGQSQSAVDVFGLANYRFNDRFDASLFVSHSFNPMGGKYTGGMRSPYIPGISSACTVVGGEFGIKVNESVRFGVGVSVVREEGPSHPLH